MTPQERNRVAINFTIEEGDDASIARINIVGNKAFTERAAPVARCTLTTPGWLTWYTKNDQYSKQKLSADLETLRSFYQNRGYLEFNIDSTQVSISPDKEEHLHHDQRHRGRRATRSREVSIAGDLAVDGARAAPADPRASRARRSRARACRRRSKAISERLGAEGYAFANVNAVPEIDRDEEHGRRSRSSSIRGRRVYVRKINISGNPKTRDEVIRREMRQLEGAWYDGTAHRAVEGARPPARLLRGRHVNIETPPVPGTPDQVDIELTVVEKNTGNLLAGVGYSSAEGVVFNASVSQQNIFGSGNALALSRQHEQDQPHVSRSRYTEPYWTVDGVSRTLELYQRKNSIPTGLAISQYSSYTLGGALGFGVPVTETDTINFGFRVEHTELDAVREQPADLLPVRPGLRLLHEQLHPVRAAGRVTPATTSSILRAAVCRAALRRGRACRPATLRTTRLQYVQPVRSGRSTATSC